MALFKCDVCHHFQETLNEHIGKNAVCPKCKEKGTIFDAVSYAKEITEKYIFYKSLSKDKEKEDNITEIEDEILELHDAIPIDDFNIHNTDIFSQEDHYSPIMRWFNNKSIQTNIDSKMMDTTGFFDEVAVYIGENFNAISSIINQIRYVQNKKYDTVKVSLAKNSHEETKQILAFCKELHHFSFIARYTFVKKDKVIYLTLQNIPKIKSFFNGLWMEWFVLIKLIRFFKEENLIPPIVRGINITFPNKDKNELDIFFLNDQGEPVCVECKTGDFRQDLSKYLSIQKRLNIKKENFILCVFGLDKEQAEGLTSMFEITVVNEATLIHYVKSLYKS